LYWTDSFTGKIQRANLDGTGVEDLVTGLFDPFGIALDVAAGKMYWTDSGTDKIQRANLDGTGVEDLVTTGLSVPRGIALDLAASKMYWTDFFTAKIQRANLDGTGVEDLVTGLSFPFGIALDVPASNQPPIANAGNDQQICAATGSANVTLDGSGSSDPDNDLLTYSCKEGATEIATGVNPTVSLSLGMHTIALTVDDGKGGTNTDEVTVTVNAAPTANAGADQAIYLNQPVQIGGSPTASGGAAPYTYAWSPTTGLDDPALANPSASPSATTTYTVTVTDANDCTASDEVTVEVIPVKAFVFVANTLTLKRTKQSTPVPPSGNIHSNGTLTIEKGNPSTYNSNLTAVGKITIQKDNTINGDVTSATSISNSGTINGTASVGPVDTEALPSLSYSAGGANKTVPSGGSLAVAPGSYNIVTLNSGGTLKLTSGEYFMNELRYSGSEAVIEIDLTSGDPITINVVSNLQLGKEAAIQLLPNGESDSKLVTFNTLQSTAVSFGKEAYLLGSFNAPNAKVTLVKNSQLRGAICANEILVESDCLFLHHDSPGALPGPGNLPKASFEEEETTSDQSTVTSYQLEQNYPNPFNPSTAISFALPQASEVSLAIFNTNGQLVCKLDAGQMNAGRHSFTWDATDDRGLRVASGVYLYVIKAGEFTAQRKLVLMK
jgi:hypothetical protein